MRPLSVKYIAYIFSQLVICLLSLLMEVTQFLRCWQEMQFFKTMYRLLIYRLNKTYLKAHIQHMGYYPHHPLSFNSAPTVSSKDSWLIYIYYIIFNITRVIHFQPPSITFHHFTYLSCAYGASNGLSKKINWYENLWLPRLLWPNIFQYFQPPHSLFNPF